jgi:hypothetical protein
MTPEATRVIKEAAHILATMGFRIGFDVDDGDTELLTAMVNSAGRAVATLRAALEIVPEGQRS